MGRKEGRKNPQHFSVHCGITFNLHNISMLHIKTLRCRALQSLAFFLSLHPFISQQILSSCYLPVMGIGNRWTCEIDTLPALKDLRVQHVIKHGIIKIIIAYLTNCNYEKYIKEELR